MKIYFKTGTDINNAMRRAGYGLIRNGSYVRRMGRLDYPRFHVYIESGYASLHLDQKQASYEGSKAHSGEADSEVVMAEGDRIKNIIDSLSIIRKEETVSQPEEKTGFWGKIFG